MTRDEAIKAFRGFMVFATDGDLSIDEKLSLAAEKSIDAYAALGMLKLDDLKSRNKAFCLAYNLMDEEGHHAAQILSLLDGAGLKIVEK